MANMSLRCKFRHRFVSFWAEILPLVNSFKSHLTWSFTPLAPSCAIVNCESTLTLGVSADNMLCVHNVVLGIIEVCRGLLLSLLGGNLKNQLFFDISRVLRLIDTSFFDII